MSSVVRKEPVFHFTRDIDRAPEFVIEEVLDTFANYELPSTPFVTHKADAIEQCFKHEKQKVCAYPNYFSFVAKK